MRFGTVSEPQTLPAERRSEVKRPATWRMSPSSIAAAEKRLGNMTSNVVSHVCCASVLPVPLRDTSVRHASGTFCAVITQTSFTHSVSNRDSGSARSPDIVLKVVGDDSVVTVVETHPRSKRVQASQLSGQERFTLSKPQMQRRLEADSRGQDDPRRRFVRPAFPQNRCQS
ncbi:hypothetical protein PHSY_000338 [Pseudozyma hubeiensis SY62]|uniref:Uncharacterized protein n=1 Tax=Pseudozyma hubeiensis (strain SY62) TaxID=1305764 RepID=R9NWD8_PSEHS|nr:hypothetical protein PHSY_000338 [Pseudozyma hubeiensis SY62]GAC92782.1 hypothetical protein PHSY_000338 [Pseudozyma hubeiensis SY62]